jgi:hypothetical protein
MSTVKSVAATWNSPCELTDNSVIRNNTHSVEPINIYKMKKGGFSKESFDLRRPRLRIAYFPSRKTGADFGKKETFPTTRSLSQFIPFHTPKTPESL